MFTCDKKETRKGIDMCKRFISLVLTAAIVLSLGLCACSKSEETTKKKKKVKKTTKTESVETDDTDISSDTSDPGDDPTDKTDPPSDPTTDPGSYPVDGDGKMVGISLPTKVLQRWNGDGDMMKKDLEDAGYMVMLYFADNDIAAQQSQISEMVRYGCDVIIVAAIDGYALGPSLEEAKAAGISVIAYDRLIYNTEDVDYFVTFDNYGAGTLQGEYIRDTLDLDNSVGPFTMEIFTGDPGDYNAALYFNGAIDVLKPYIDSGKLVVRSGQTSFDQCATAGWRTEYAQERMDAILSANYMDTDLDAVLCTNDSIALGVENSLEAMYIGKYPIITGMDCDIQNTKNILNGKQAMSVFKDTRTLCDCTVVMATDLLEGRTPVVNDQVTYDNGKKVVDAFLAQAVFANIDNYEKVLIDSGYYTKDDLE